MHKDYRERLAQARRLKTAAPRHKAQCTMHKAECRMQNAKGSAPPIGARRGGSREAHMPDTVSMAVFGLIVGLTAGLTPGPLTALVLTQTLRYGTREGLKVAVAPLITDLPIIAAAFLFGRSLGDNRYWIGALNLLGASVLLYLAYEAFVAQEPQAAQATEATRSVGKAVVANLTNPNPYLFWLAIGVPTLQRASEVGPGAVAAFTFALYTCLVGSMMLLAYLAGLGKGVLAGRAYRLTLRTLSLMLVAFAVSFLLNGLKSLQDVA